MEYNVNDVIKVALDPDNHVITPYCGIGKIVSAKIIGNKCGVYEICIDNKSHWCCDTSIVPEKDCMIKLLNDKNDEIRLLKDKYFELESKTANIVRMYESTIDRHKRDMKSIESENSKLMVQISELKKIVENRYDFVKYIAVFAFAGALFKLMYM